ncbi:MAG TPA: iron-sulfur cluster carrier protein ApbC [Sorangium sp.]|nr:iron-sulfur cluster carrier protein ApbC [Sorangium sp.]
MALTEQAALNALATVIDPEIKRPLVELGMVRDVHVTETKVCLGVDLTTAACPLKSTIENDIVAALKGAGASEVTIDWGVKAMAREIGADDPCPGVKNIVLVMSGKGGVGKSTVASNIAMSLKRVGCRVGLLDADMYGPSVPTMFGVMGRPAANKAGRIRPLERFGVKLMSIGFMLENERAAVIWRGPMLQGALLQFLKDVEWGELDYLILDLPPGTGDVALTLAQRIKTTGAVMVTTPQEVALADVYKAVAMLQKVGITMLGVVENESYFVCDGCDKRHELFGSGGGAKIAEFSSAPLLGQIPLHPAVREWSDAGTPVVQAAPGSDIAQSFQQVAQRVADRCSVVNAARAPDLTIDRSGGKNRHLPIAR